MLIELRITDFAIIDRLELHLGAGLVVFTGETGAGKSIIIDALGTILGQRADRTMVRSGASRALIEGTFRLAPSTAAVLHPILAAEDLLDDPEYLTLGREIQAGGRSVARVNGRSVPLSLLRTLGEHLVDVHGQTEHLSLLRVREHLGLLDRFGQHQEALAAYQAVYRDLRAVQQEIARLEAAERDAARRMDLLQYQINEIEAAGLTPGEDQALQAERTRLANAEHLARLGQQALLALDEGTPETPAAGDLLGEAVAALEALARLDATQAPLAGQAQALVEHLADLTHDLRLYLESVEFNPARLEEVEERLELIRTLQRKYGERIEDILAFAERARAELEAITTAGERLAELRDREAALLQTLAERGLALSAARRQAAERLAQAIEAELAALRMGRTRFAVDFRRKPDPQGVPLPDGQRVAFDAQGLEQVEFLIETNPGEGLKPLARVASGGETARLMLALKSVLAGADPTPTLIFDEIDQGIGGRVGALVGRKLKGLAAAHQVLCITHLPQLAAFGDLHFRVTKAEQQGRTVTRVQPLQGEERVLELAAMLGGVSEGTLRSAHELLQAVG